MGILMSKVLGVGVEGELDTEGKDCRGGYRISEQRWWEGQRAEDLSVDRMAWTPLG